MLINNHIEQLMRNDDETQDTVDRQELMKATYYPNQLDRKQSHAWFDNGKDKRTKSSPASEA